MVGCVAIGCKNSFEKGYIMRKFPTDPQRRSEWVKKVGRGENWIPRHSSLCEVHFAPEMWEQRMDNKPKLKPNTVPTRFGPEAKEKTIVPANYMIEGVSEENENHIEQNINYSSKENVQEIESEFILPDQSKNYQQIASSLRLTFGNENSVQEVLMKFEEEERQFILPYQSENYQAVVSTSAEVINTQQELTQFEKANAMQFFLLNESENCHQVTTTQQFLPGDVNNAQKRLGDLEKQPESQFILPHCPENYKRTTTTPLQSSSGDISDVQVKLAKLERENARQLKVIERLSKAIGSKDYQLIMLRKILRTEKCKIRTLEDRINNDKYKIALSRIFNDDQVQSLVYNRSPRKWSTETIKRALQIKLTCGINGYELLRKQSIPLPDLQTIRRFLQNKANEPICFSQLLEMCET